MTKAIVVGSGPNGLAAALTLAAEGIEVSVLEAEPNLGGGTRSVEVTLPGLLHDECSGFHPLAQDNQFVRQFDLHKHGLEWAWPEVQYSHPLDGGRGAAVRQSVADTAETLGADSKSYARMFGPLANQFPAIAEEFLQPMLHIPRHPFALARFGLFAAMPATLIARRWSSPEAKGLFAGVAAHAFRPLGSFMSSAIGVALGTAAHTYGWPVARGGSQAISQAMIAELTSMGVTFETNARVTEYKQVADAELVLLDTSPSAAIGILGDRLPSRVARAYRNFQHGPGSFQVSFAVEGGIPWTHEDSRLAGTVHIGGSIEEIAAAEKQIWQGKMPERPFVLLGQQSLADPSRAKNNIHPIDAYAHVPAGFEGDATEAIIAQIERFAPGFRERIHTFSTRSTTQIAGMNANFVGGDITTGANTPRQLVFRPRVALDPYSTAVPGVYLCSAATPPGAGAHGMSGWHAAQSALKSLGLKK